MHASVDACFAGLQGFKRRCAGPRELALLREQLYGQVIAVADLDHVIIQVMKKDLHQRSDNLCPQADGRVNIQGFTQGVANSSFHRV